MACTRNCVLVVVMSVVFVLVLKLQISQYTFLHRVKAHKQYYLDLGSNAMTSKKAVKNDSQQNITIQLLLKKGCPRIITETRQGTAVVLSKTVYDKSLDTVPDHKHTLCVIEVGTADGRGTTLALIKSLDSWCRKTARSWRLFSYEGLSDKYNSAKNFLGNEEPVQIVNELVMTKNNLDNMVLPYIDAPTGERFPGLEFYQGVYRMTTTMMKDGKMGQFLTTRPPCARGGIADFVSIDTTRYTFSAILQTLMDKKMVDVNTRFAMENDFWTKSDGTQDTALKMVSRFFEVLDVKEYTSGHDFPWVSFRIEQQRRHGSEKTRR